MMRTLDDIPPIGGRVGGRIVQRRQIKGDLLRLLLDGEWQVFKLIPKTQTPPPPTPETPNPRIGKWFRLTWNTAVWQVVAIDGDYVICKSRLAMQEGKDWPVRVHRDRLIPLPDICPLLQALSKSSQTNEETETTQQEGDGVYR